MQFPPPNQSQSYSSYWREIAVTLAAFGALMGVVAVAVFDSQFMRAFDRCKDRVTNRLELWYAERIRRIDNAMQVVGVNSDRIEGMEASIMQQGAALQTQLGAHFTQSATAMQGVVTALTAVQREAQATAEAVARIEGYIEADKEWSGVNRRKRVRRKQALGTP